MEKRKEKPSLFAENSSNRLSKFSLENNFAKLLVLRIKGNWIQLPLALEFGVVQVVIEVQTNERDNFQCFSEYSFRSSIWNVKK